MPEQTPQPMPEQSPEPSEHRFARAAGKATRAFLDATEQDKKERHEQKTRRDARAAQSRRGAQSQQPARGQRKAPGNDQPSADVGNPVLLTVARWWWAVVTVVLALLAVSFILSGLSMPEASPEGDPLGGSTGQYVLAGAAGILAAATGTGTVQLLRSKRNAAGLLTGVAVVVGIPLIIRGHPALIVVAAVLLAGAALLWLPPVRRRLG